MDSSVVVFGGELVAGARGEKCWWMWRRNARDMGIYREGEC
jgi:hypothetical protein